MLSIAERMRAASASHADKDLDASGIIPVRRQRCAAMMVDRKCTPFKSRIQQRTMSNGHRFCEAAPPVPRRKIQLAVRWTESVVSRPRSKPPYRVEMLKPAGCRNQNCAPDFHVQVFSALITHNTLKPSLPKLITRLY